MASPEEIRAFLKSEECEVRSEDLALYALEWAQVAQRALCRMSS